MYWMPMRYARILSHPLMALTLLLLSSLHCIVGGDLLWHIKVGEYARQHHVWLRHDLFSYSFSGAPVALHAPLFQWLMTSIHHYSGFSGLIVLQAFVVGLIGFLLWRMALDLGAARRLSAWLLLAALWWAGPQMALHPQLFFFLWVVLFFYLSPWRGQAWYRLGVCTMLLGVWPWLHPSFLAGTLLMLYFALGLIFSPQPQRCRYGIAWCAAALLATLSLIAIEPNFLTNNMEHLTATAMLSSIKYWQPLWQLAPDNLMNIVLLLQLGLLSGFVLYGVRRCAISDMPRWWLGLGVVVLIGVGLSAVRFYPLILLLLTPMALACINKLQWRHKPIWLLVLSFTQLGLAAYVAFSNPHYVWGMHLDQRQLPVGCLTYVQQQKLPGNMYNAYNFGHYLIYAFDGEHKVLIDPRSSQLYPDDFIAQFVAAYHEPKVFESLVQTYDVGYTMLPTKSPMAKTLLHYLDQQPTWQRRYQDPICTIHVRLSPATKRK